MINELKKIREELLTGVENNDLLYIKMQINNIDTLIHNLVKNGETVKRQELIDFLKWKEGSYCGSSLNQEAEVNRYLKSINE